MSEKIKPPVTEEKLKPAPLEKLPDLKAIREIRELTLKDISHMTKISFTNLEAIESGEFHLLPAPVYTKKFIEIYAKTIGIDAQNILAHYQRYVDETRDVPEEVPVVKTQITFDHKPFKRYFLYAIPVVAIIAIAFTMYAFFHDNNPLGAIQHNMTGAEVKEVVPKPVAVKAQPPEAVPDVPSAPSPAMAVHEETAQPPSNTDLNLLIEATEDTWLKITEDRNHPYQIILKAGGKLSRKAREFFLVDVGNAAGVNITFNGTPLGSLGRKGQVVHLRLPRQNPNNNNQGLTP
ncbi:MAG: DUF4115 domain-containing protein [Desulfuromonadaceae bacterium]|nr:DUF4115 domain-containing protein [Desulfuromonadaceae bacterium]